MSNFYCMDVHFFLYNRPYYAFLPVILSMKANHQIATTNRVSRSTKIHFLKIAMKKIKKNLRHQVPIFLRDFIHEKFKH